MHKIFIINKIRLRKNMYDQNVVDIPIELTFGRDKFEVFDRKGSIRSININLERSVAVLEIYEHSQKCN